MSVFKAFFGLGKIPQVVKFFEFQSFDDVNKMGGAIRALKEQARMSGTQLTKAQERYLDDQMKQVEMVFEQIQQPSTQSGIRSTKSAKVFDLQGNRIDPNKPIMGGTQEIDKAIDNASPGFAGDRKYDAQLVADDLANKRFGKEFYDLDEIDQMKLYDEAYQGLSKQRFLDKELMKTDNPFSDLVKTTEKGPKGIKEREAEILERMNKSNKKNVGIIKRRKMREEISKVNDQIEEMIESGVNENNPELAKLYDKQNDLELKLDFEDMMSPDPEDFAQGGRAGFKDGLLSMLDIKAEGSKSGKQQIEGAPGGITADEESINAIIKADIPISQKIDLLAKYQYGKGRTRIEKDNSEIFLDEGGFKSRDIGLGFNKDGEGIGGTLMYNLETGEPQFNIGFKKSFANGGRIGLKDGMDRRTFMKIMGGLATLPIVGKLAKGAKLAAPAAKKIAEITAPALDKIIETVMSAGKLVSQSGRKLKELTTKKKLKDIEVEEDMMDGPSYTIKTKDKTIYYKPGKQDEMGFDDDIIEVIEDTVTKKASGGVARMLGE